MQTTGVDGHIRSAEVEKELNRLFARVGSTPDGEKLFNYLRNISLHQILPAGMPDNSYAYQEGARWLFSIIQQRYNKGLEDDGSTSRPEPRKRGR